MDKEKIYENADSTLKVTTTEIFQEIVTRLNLNEGGERELKEVLMQLDQHIVTDDFREEEWERRE